MTTDEEIVTMLKDLNAKVDALQRNQALLRPDIIDHVIRILSRRWKDEEVRRREATW